MEAVVSAVLPGVIPSGAFCRKSMAITRLSQGRYLNDKEFCRNSIKNLSARPERGPHTSLRREVTRLSLEDGTTEDKSGDARTTRRTILSLTASCLTGGAAIASTVRKQNVCGCQGCAAPDKKGTLYQRFFAHAMATGMDGYEAHLQPYKRRLFTLVSASTNPAAASPPSIGARPNAAAAASSSTAPLISNDAVNPSRHSASAGGARWWAETSPDPQATEDDINSDAAAAARSASAPAAPSAYGGADASGAGGGGTPRGGAPSDVLEIGIGAGPNLGYYAGSLQGGGRVVGLDPNPAMEEYARSAARGAGLAQLDFMRGVSEHIPLPDASVDVVIGTLVLCSVTDAVASLQEVRRVLHPNGRYFFIEHVAAPSGWTTG